jgi:hypothetical protein
MRCNTREASLETSRNPKERSDLVYGLLYWLLKHATTISKGFKVSTRWFDETISRFAYMKIPRQLMTFSKLK